MSQRKPLSRRAFLRGSGGAIVALPFLEAMVPTNAWAATAPARMVAVFGGIPATFNKATPAPGALGSVLHPSIESLGSVRQHVSVLSGTRIPEYTPGTSTTPEPGSCAKQPHYTAPASLLAGVTSSGDGFPMLHKAHTIDQVFADANGMGTPHKFLHIKTQNLGYGFKSGGEMSSRYENNVTNINYDPTISPLELYTKIFSTFTAPTGNPPPVSQAVLNRRSVLDLIAGDSTRLINKLGGSDKIRLEQHFEEIRAIERRLASTSSGTTGGSCSKPSQPADPASGLNQFGGWSNETIRGDLQADIIAMALACDITRSVAWMLTNDQCGLGALNISGVNLDLHDLSHKANSDSTLYKAMEKHTNWHCARFARLVQTLASLPEGTGSVLDNTFLGMGFGEGSNAHNRSNMMMVIGGRGGQIKLGQHFATAGDHPARVWIAGLNASGLPHTKLGEVSGPMTAILK